MQVKIKNIILGMRLFFGPFGFLLAMIVGGLMMAFSPEQAIDPFKLVLAGLISGFLFHMAGRLAAMTLERIEYEISDERLTRDDEEETLIGANVDVTQGAETPSAG